jgi:hypothetical protein
MSDNEDHNAVSDNDASETLTKPKKQRSEKQIAATERMRAALAAKQKPSLDAAAAKIDVKGKKEILKALKNKLNSAKEPLDVEEETDNESVEEPIQVAPKKIKKVPAVSAATHKDEPVKSVKPKKKPKVIEESETESEEEVIVIKKKKKPKKKKTIIYESATESEEEEEPVQKPVRKERETKTQQNAASKFKVTPGVADSKPKGPIYYFA